MTEQTETKPQKKKNLLKSGMIVSASTLLSRILGLVRDVIIANLLGASLAADVFFFANRITRHSYRYWQNTAPKITAPAVILSAWLPEPLVQLSRSSQ